MPSGGKREGAGRKRTREKHIGKVNAAEKKLADKLPQVAEALLELALGVTVEEIDKEGATVIYTRAPDRAACEAILNRIMGKPTPRIEEGAESDEPLKVQIVPEDTDYRTAAHTLAPHPEASPPDS